MLRVSLLGNLGADPELKYTQKGNPMATFRVAVDQVDTTPEGERQERTEWFRVRAMGRLAESAQRLEKGMRVLVVGRLDISHFQSREGEARVGFDVWADEVVGVSPRTGGPEAGAHGETSARDSEAGESDAQDREPVGQARRGAGPTPPAPVGAAGAASVGRHSADTRAPGSSDLEDLPF